MGSTADFQDMAMDHLAHHKSLYEERRVPPAQWEMNPKDMIYGPPPTGRINDPFFYCQRCGAPVAFCQCPKLADAEKWGEQMADAMIQAVKDQLPKADPIKPNYYRRTIKGVEIDAIDIIQAFGLGFLLGNALKYILRAGQKDDRKQDLSKAVENIRREIDQSK